MGLCERLSEPQHRLDLLYRGWFREMQVKARMARAAAILFPAPPGQRNEDEAMGMAASTDAAGRLIAVDARHADVDEDDIRLKLVHCCDAGETVVGGVGDCPQGLQQKCKAVSNVMIVVYYERPRSPLTHRRPLLSLSYAYAMSYRSLKFRKHRS